MSVPGPASSVSLSWMKSLKSCAVHCSPAAKFTFGMIVIVRVPLPANVAEKWLPVVLQLMS